MESMSTSTPSARPRRDFGPQTAQLEKLLATIAELPADTVRALAYHPRIIASSEPWGPDYPQKHYEATQMLWSAAGDGACDGYLTFEVALANHQTNSAVPDPDDQEALSRVLEGAILGLHLRDRIGTGSFRQDHYDLLTAPWRTVVGPLHHDDGPAPADALAASCTAVAHEERFGQQTPHIDALVEKVGTLNLDRLGRMYQHHHAMRLVEGRDLLDHAQTVANVCGRDLMLETVCADAEQSVILLLAFACVDVTADLRGGEASEWTPVLAHGRFGADTVTDAILQGALPPLWSALAGLVLRDVIGSHGFTQADYDLLTGSWRSGVGPVHPDDAPIPGA